MSTEFKTEKKVPYADDANGLANDTHRKDPQSDLRKPSDALGSLSVPLTYLNAAKHLAELTRQREPWKGEVPQAIGADTSNGKIVPLRKGAIPFREKFNRQSKGANISFKKGERISSDKFMVTVAMDNDERVDETHIELLVVEDGIGVRNADSFIIPVTPSEYTFYRDKDGHSLGGVVEITGEGMYSISNAYRYPAKVITLESNMKIISDPGIIDQLQSGTDALVEGTIIERYNVGSREMKLVIQTGQNESVDVTFNNEVEFEESTGQENIEGKKPEIGDVIRIVATVSSLPGEKKGSDVNELRQANELGFLDSTKSNELTASWCRSTYLLAPSSSRKDRFDALRSEVDLNLNELVQALRLENFSNARQSHAKLMKQELTSEELKKFDSLHNSFPVEERPVIAHGMRDAVNAVNKRFAVDVDLMTRDEFKTFALGQANHPFGQRVKGNESDIHTIMVEINMPHADREEIYTTAIKSRLEYLSNLKADRGTLEHEMNWDDQYFARQSIIRLQDSPTISSIDTIFSVIDELASDINDHPSFFLVADASLTLAQIVKKAQYHDNKEVINYMKGQLSKLSEFEKFFQGKSEAIISDITEVIQILIPKYDNLRKADFQQQLISEMKKLSTRSEIISMALDSIEKNKYTIRRMDVDDPSMPTYIKRFSNDRYGAITEKQHKELYVNLSSLEKKAFYDQKTLEHQLVETLSNEAVHLLSDLIYEKLTKNQVNEELTRIRNSDARHYTKTEKLLHDVIAEEVTSELVGKEEAKRLTEPNYMLTEHDLSNSNNNYKNIKATIGASIVARIYPTEEMEQDDLDVVYERVVGFLNSGELEEKVKSQLNEFQLKL